jgi:(p)ppGpp synthase/HD superfamily hydrolase
MTSLERQKLLAIGFARAAHAGQFDKDGTELHFEHVSRVAGLVWEDDGDRIVAYLHDVIEDSPAGMHDLLAIGIAPELVHDVDTLTQRKKLEPREAYNDYIERVAGGSSRARRVKVADLTDNIERARRTGREGLAKRYARALERLGAGERVNADG